MNAPDPHADGHECPDGIICPICASEPIELVIARRPDLQAYREEVRARFRDLGLTETRGDPLLGRAA